MTPLGSVDLSAVEVISDHVENINAKLINQNSGNDGPQSLRICKTISIMRKLTFTEKKPTIYYTNPESTPLDLSKL